MTPCDMINIPSFMKINAGIQAIKVLPQKSSDDVVLVLLMEGIYKLRR
jgi:hypothetical protein